MKLKKHLSQARQASAKNVRDPFLWQGVGKPKCQRISDGFVQKELKIIVEHVYIFFDFQCLKLFYSVLF